MQPSVETARPVPEGFTFVEAISGIEEYRLDANGLQVLVYPQASAPVAAFMVTYRVGSRNEWTGVTGATHMLEHLMFKGTARFNRRGGMSIFNVLQRVGAQVNATTWYDRTNYYEMLPSEHLPLAMEIEADRMRGSLLDAEDVESERTVILNEFDRGENEPLRKLYQTVWSAAFVAHPYHHPTIGWRSDIEGISPGDLRHFYDTFYWPDNATLSIIGDVDTAEALALVEHHFGGIPQAPEPWPEVYTREPVQKGERRVVVRQSGQLGSVMIAYKQPPAASPDADALEVLSFILGSGKNSRLFTQLTDRGLTTNAFASASRLRDPGLFYLFAFLSPERAHEEVERALLDVVERVRQEGVTQAELARAQRQIIVQEAFGRDGPFSIASHLNEAIAAGDWRLYAHLPDRIKSVTADDVHRVARTYLIPEASTTGYYIPV